MSTAPVRLPLPSNGLQAEPVDGLASDALAAESRGPQAQLLVLSRNPELVEVVRNSALSVARVTHARDLDDAARSLSHVEPGVLLIDGSIADDIGTIVAQSTRRFPDVVVVVVGTRDESSELMQLAAAGRIFRFLLMPLSYGPVRLTLAAAVSQYVERRAASRSIASTPSESHGGRRKHVFIYVAVAVTLLATIGVLWHVSGLLAARAPASAAAPARPAPEVISPAAAPSELERAATALQEGRYVEPVGSSALDLYRSVLQAEPDNAAARAGIRAVTDQLLQRVEQALLDENLDAAEDTLQQAREVEADHPRLSFFETSLMRQRQLTNLSQRRDVAERVRELVIAARSELRAGNLIGTALDGAVGPLIKARRLDATDPGVVQLTRELNAALADAVQMALKAGDTARARAFGTAARRLGAGDQLLAAIERSIKESKSSAVPPPVAAPQPAPAPTPTRSTIELMVEQSVRAAEALAPAPASAEPPVLQAGELRRIRQVMPTYPVAAAADGIEGYVDLEFTIATDGVPRNLVVVGGTPRRVFDSAAMNCVRQWRFAPLTENGLPVARRATLRVRFQLQ